MKATMRTSPVFQSCAIAGTRPSSFVKSSFTMEETPFRAETSVWRRRKARLARRR